MNEQSDLKSDQSSNIGYEIILIKLARELFEYIKLQNSYERLTSIEPILRVWHSEIDNYVNQTDRLHPDLGLELNEYFLFKFHFYETRRKMTDQSKEKDRSDNESIEAYGRIADKIIVNLEHELGIGGYIA